MGKLNVLYEVKFFSEVLVKIINVPIVPERTDFVDILGFEFVVTNRKQIIANLKYCYIVTLDCNEQYLGDNDDKKFNDIKKEFLSANWLKK